MHPGRTVNQSFAGSQKRGGIKGEVKRGKRCKRGDGA